MLKKSDYRFFIEAKKMAFASDYPKQHVGCIAVYQGKIIGRGCNLNKTHPIQKYYNIFRMEEGKDYQNCLPKLHAEIHCLSVIRNLPIDFGKVKLYIYRLRRDREFGIARPCPSCMKAIRDLGIRNIYYTGNESYVYEKLILYKETKIKEAKEISYSM